MNFTKSKLNNTIVDRPMKLFSSLKPPLWQHIVQQYIQFK